METSIYNLTQPEATGLVHYSPTDMKVIELVRLQEPGWQVKVLSRPRQPRGRSRHLPIRSSAVVRFTKGTQTNRLRVPFFLLKCCV